MFRSLLSCAIAFCAIVAVSPSQVEIADIVTTNVHPILNPDAPDYTFGVKMDPDDVHAWVTVSGALSFGTTGTANNQILKIDVQTHAIVSRAIVGFYPEDIVLHVDANGDTDRIYVANSDDSSVSVLSASLSPIATIPLGFCFITIGHFPFQLALRADGNELYVGTLGCGEIFKVDTDATSPNYHTVTSLVNYNGLHGSVSVHPALAQSVIAGSSVEFGGFAGTVGTVDVIDASVAPPAVQVLTLSPQVTGDFASVSDIVPLGGTRALVVENSQFFARLYEVDLATMSILTVHDLGTQVPGLAFLSQAAVDADERIVIVTSLVEDLIFYDRVTRNVVSVVHYPSGVPQPSDVAFTLDGTRAVVTFQNEETVRIYGSLPSGLEVSVGGTPAVGQTITLDHQQGAPFDAEAVFVSGIGQGPEVIAGYTLLLNQPFFLLGFAYNDVMGNGTLPVTIPGTPALAGFVAYVQSFTAQPQFRFSNPLAITVLP